MDELRGFLSGYLHEDWYLEADDPMVLARQFGATGDPDVVARVVEQGRRVLDDADSDGDLARRLRALGCHYRPDGSEMVRDWFTRFLAAIEHEPR